jgi:DNA polymerase-1
MNIQTIPRKDTLVKGAFFPKQDYLLFADYSQIEYRIWGWYMDQQVGDPRIVETFREGKDVHLEQAKRIFEALGWEWEESDANRQYGKTNNFAAVYAGGVPTVQRQLGCDARTARTLVEAFHSDNPLLGRWKWEGRGFSDPSGETLNGMLVSTLRDRGYIVDLWGRELFPEVERNALNQLCQGGAADLMKKAMVTVYDGLAEAGCQSHMVLSVHDEVGVDGVEDELDFLKENIPKWMDDDALNAVLPVEVDMKLTRTSWAEAKEVA